MKVSKKLQALIDQIDRLAWADVTRKTGDAAFVATVRAINERCALADTLGQDRTVLRRHMDTLYPEFARRIGYAKDIQKAHELIESLESFIYGRRLDEKDLGPQSWRHALIEAALKAVTAYRKGPKMHALDYAHLLLHYAGKSRDRQLQQQAVQEVQALVNSQIADADHSLPDEEWMRRILLRDTNTGGVYAVDTTHDDEWTAVMERLIGSVKPKSLTDPQLLLWITTARMMNRWYIPFSVDCDHVLPEAIRELTKRKSTADGIDSLSIQAWNELSALREAERRAKARREDKLFHDDFLQDIVSINIDNTLTTEALLALSNIYLNRMMSVSFIFGERESAIRAFCKRRLVEIYALLSQRLRQSTDVYLQVRMLQAISSMEYELGSLGTTRDTKALVERSVDALLRDNTLPYTATVQLLALKYDGHNYDGMTDEPGYKLLSAKAEQLKSQFTGEIDLQMLKALRMAMGALRQSEAQPLLSAAYCHLAEQAIAQHDVLTLRGLAEAFGSYWPGKTPEMYSTICAVATALQQIAAQSSAPTSDDALIALSAIKFIESRYEMDINSVQIPGYGIELYSDINANEVADWLLYLVKRDNTNTKLTRKLLLALLQRAFDEQSDGMGKLILPVDTASLVKILQVDLHLHRVDADYVDSDECVFVCDVACEMECRGNEGDAMAQVAYEEYMEGVKKIMRSEKG